MDESVIFMDLKRQNVMDNKRLFMENKKYQALFYPAQSLITTTNYVVLLALQRDCIIQKNSEDFVLGFHSVSQRNPVQTNDL